MLGPLLKIDKIAVITFDSFYPSEYSGTDFTNPYFKIYSQGGKLGIKAEVPSGIQVG